MPISWREGYFANAWYRFTEEKPSHILPQNLLKEAAIHFLSTRWNILFKHLYSEMNYKTLKLNFNLLTTNVFMIWKPEAVKILF